MTNILSPVVLTLQCCSLIVEADFVTVVPAIVTVIVELSLFVVVTVHLSSFCLLLSLFLISVCEHNVLHKQNQAF